MMKYILTSICALILFTSCEDLLTKELPLEDIGYERQIVVNAQLTSDQDTLRVLLTENISFTANQELIFIDDATVSLFQDGSEIATLVKTAESGIYIHDFGGAVGGEGTDFRLDISHPSLTDVTTTCNMPTETSIQSLKYLENAGTLPGQTEPFPGLEIKFTDPAALENFYSFSAYVDTMTFDTFIFNNDMDTIIYENNHSVYTASIDPNVEFGWTLNHLTDTNYNGSDYTVILSLEYFSDIPMEEILEKKLLKFRWYNVSKDHYQYDTSLERYWAGQDFGLFQEPISIHTNVENGLGIFSCYSVEEYIIEE